MSPTQARNLEKATGADVHDRTQVILGIFHRHARTREARLQVEIARLAYEAPRLREGGGGGDRVRGGVGGKGAGEARSSSTARRIRDRIAELRRELAAIEAGGKTRRQRRGDARTIAVVGYTNAGKSSLMRALTGSEVYVADKLFATLDTTVRVLDGRVKPPLLLSDTVGFIKKLPHDLVASFRSTLEEAAVADLLLQVVDAADPAFRDHMAVTRGVLGEVGADAPMLLVLNKADRLDPAARTELALAFPDAVLMSAKDAGDVAALRERLIEHFAGAAVTAELVVPWARHKLIHELHTRCRVLDEHHDEHGTRVTVRAPTTIIDELRAALTT
ncbi:MAG: GTPase HflX [Kofleriaceae bacterium]|nr:GTPase HflX [Kofleriaceae bacterium]